MSVSPENLDSVCEGCLSPERPELTTEVTDLEIKKLYFEIINIVENIDSLSLRLCSECKANMLKYVAFRKQVVEAHDILNKYLLKSRRCSTKLSNRLNQPDSSGFNQLPQSTVPLTFIKIEDNLDVADDVDDYFVDDGCSRDRDDKDLTAVLQPDLIEPNKLEVVSNRGSVDDFDASDDEPLHKKKLKKEAGKKSKKKKKKKKGDNSTKSERKQRAPRKEKPPGVVDNPRVRKKLQQLNVPQGQLEMVILSWAEVAVERQRALSSETFTRHEYRCDDCALGFNHRFKLTNHMKKHDPSAGELVCSVCRVRCKHAHALAAHRRRHRVRSLAKLRNHMNSHGARQSCELCAKSFRDRAALRTHLFIHRGEKEHACPRCDKRFLFKKAMQVHLVTHDGHAHLYCYECDLNFKNRMSYKQHMKYSLKHVDPAKLKYSCLWCDKRFVKAARLEEHKLAVHLKATPIACTVPGCGFMCSSRPVLRTHRRMRHGGGRAARNHVCHKCGKTYMTKKTLEGHLRSHTGERPFKCSHCSSTFGYSSALYNHNKLVHNAKLSKARPVSDAPLAI